MKKNVNVGEQYRNNNSVRQYNQWQTGQLVGLSNDKWTTLDIRQYGSLVMCVREVKIEHCALLHLHQHLDSICCYHGMKQLPDIHCALARYGIVCKTCLNLRMMSVRSYLLAETHECNLPLTQWTACNALLYF